MLERVGGPLCDIPESRACRRCRRRWSTAWPRPSGESLRSVQRTRAAHESGAFKLSRHPAFATPLRDVVGRTTRPTASCRRSTRSRSVTPPAQARGRLPTAPVGSADEEMRKGRPGSATTKYPAWHDHVVRGPNGFAPLDKAVLERIACPDWVQDVRRSLPQGVFSRAFETERSVAPRGRRDLNISMSRRRRRCDEKDHNKRCRLARLTQQIRSCTSARVC
jgi:hypothetical protein